VSAATHRSHYLLACTRKSPASNFSSRFNSFSTRILLIDNNFLLTTSRCLPSFVRLMPAADHFYLPKDSRFLARLLPIFAQFLHAFYSFFIRFLLALLFTHPRTHSSTPSLHSTYALTHSLTSAHTHSHTQAAWARSHRLIRICSIDVRRCDKVLDARWLRVRDRCSINFCSRSNSCTIVLQSLCNRSAVAL
jgi:hypothetical protein